MHMEEETAYATAIRSLGEVMSVYDNDKCYPIYGFGAKIPPSHSVRSLVSPVRQILRRLCDIIVYNIIVYSTMVYYTIIYYSIIYGNILYYVCQGGVQLFCFDRRFFSARS